MPEVLLDTAYAGKLAREIKSADEGREGGTFGAEEPDEETSQAEASGEAAERRGAYARFSAEQATQPGWDADDFGRLGEGMEHDQEERRAKTC